ncbi:MAG: butyryl-CoA:acetate CoA-transferase [Peptoniphilaceae bacterium]|nr:butyryl-CoA:acetate CoA-transferase [Peptoniphilaceae bacterium]MDY5841850.1 acetyl-CoA hydrolase/transferase C-terminal domain-containing protein [Peptoniphilaceae bacterium]
MARKNQKLTPEEIVSKIRSGDVIGSSLGNGNPYILYDALYERRNELKDISLSISLLVRPVKLLAGPARKAFTVKSDFMGPIEGRVFALGSTLDPQIIHLSRIPGDRYEGHVSNVIMLVAAPPDAEGNISFGVGPFDRKVIQKADMVVVQFNKKMPFIQSPDQMIHMRDVDYSCEWDEDLVYLPDITPTPAQKKIAELISERIPDGACLQLGIGGQAGAFTEPLLGKKHLGVHTELYVDPFVDLTEKGVIDNSRKNINPGKSVFGFALGTKHMHDFLDHNPLVETRSFSYVNNPSVIAQIDHFISVNSTLEVDLTGQACSESFGLRQYSGTGGQLDFVRGATASKGGQSYLTLPSTYRDKKTGEVHSRIRLMLTPGAAVTTPRADVQYICTEYGIADLRNATIHERVQRMIAIAAPEFREQLAFEAKTNGLLW